MTSSLLTVNVSFTLVNCGSPDTCMCDKNVGPQLRLVLGGDIKDNGLSYEAAVIEDALHTFQNYHGSGTSFVHFCAVHLLRHVRRNSVRIERDQLQKALHAIYTAYEHCCKALQLECTIQDDVVNLMMQHTAGDSKIIESEPQDLDTNEDLDVNEMSWFFDEPDNNADEPVLTEKELLSISKLVHRHMQSSSSSDSEHSQPTEEVITAERSVLSDCKTARNGPASDLFSHDWLVAGLQHCVAHDYAAKSSSSDLNAVALPMQLAGAVKLHLWDQHAQQQKIHQPDISSSTPSNGKLNVCDVANLLDEMSTSEGSLKHSLHRHLHVRTVPGLPVSHTCALPGALVLSCPSRNYDTLCTVSANETQRPGNDTKTATFHRTVVAKANLGMLGEHFNEQNSALGSSQQARGIAYSTIVTAEAYLHSLRANVLHERSSYVHQMCAVLVQHQVDLLLCHAGMMTINLVDCLTAHGIAVLPVQTDKELSSCADITGAEIIEDITALCDCDIGCRSVSVTYVLAVPNYDTKYKPPNVSRSGLDSSEGGDQEELCIGGFREDPNGSLQVGSDVQSDQCLVALSPVSVSTTSTAAATAVDATAVGTTAVPHYPNDQNTAQTPVSVVICAPTQIMAQAITDRFHRCLHRLRAVVEDGCAVIPGAGVPELVCILRLDEVAAGLDLHCAQIEVIRWFQQVLVEYMCTIMLNSGCSYAQSFEQANSTLCALRKRVSAFGSAASSSCGYPLSNTLAYVWNLSNEEKLALPQPIRLEDAPIGENVLVLDAVRIKLAGLHSALLAVCELVCELASVATTT